MKMIRKISEEDLQKRYCGREVFSTEGVIDYFNRLSEYAFNQGISTFYFLDNAGQFTSRLFREYSNQRNRGHKIKNIKVKAFNREDENNDLLYQISCCLEDDEKKRVGGELLTLPKISFPKLPPYYTGKGRFRSYVQENLNRISEALSISLSEEVNAWRAVLLDTEFSRDLNKGIVFVDDSIATGSTRYSLEQIVKLFSDSPLFKFTTFSAWEGTTDKGLVDFWNLYGRRDFEGKFFPYEDRPDLYRYIYTAKESLCVRNPLIPSEEIIKDTNKLSRFVGKILKLNQSDSLTVGDVFRAIREKYYSTIVSNLDFQLYAPCVGIDADRYRKYQRQFNKLKQTINLEKSDITKLKDYSAFIDNEILAIWQERKKSEVEKFRRALTQ